jgi:hypothetical protein
VLASRDGWVSIMYTGLDAVGVDQQVYDFYLFIHFSYMNSLHTTDRRVRFGSFQYVNSALQKRILPMLASFIPLAVFSHVFLLTAYSALCVSRRLFSNVLIIQLILFPKPPTILFTFLASASFCLLFTSSISLCLDRKCTIM